jgi:hypothetical protein
VDPEACFLLAGIRLEDGEIVLLLLRQYTGLVHGQSARVVRFRSDHGDQQGWIMPGAEVIKMSFRSWTRVLVGIGWLIWVAMNVRHPLCEAEVVLFVSR